MLGYLVFFMFKFIFDLDHRRRIKTEKKAKVWGHNWFTSLLCKQFCIRLKKVIHLSFSPYRPGAIHPILHIVLDQFILLSISSWCNSSYSPYCLGTIHPIFHIILVQLILFSISFCCNSSYSPYRPVAIHPILHIILVSSYSSYCPGPN